MTKLLKKKEIRELNTTAEKNMGKIKLHKGNSEQDIQQRRTELTEKKKGPEENLYRCGSRKNRM